MILFDSKEQRETLVGTSYLLACWTWNNESGEASGCPYIKIFTWEVNQKQSLDETMP
jgi:hypothetical protein